MLKQSTEGEVMLLTLGGFLCGFAAGAAALYGRLCSMSAIEDALIARDFRAAKAWGLALAVATMLTAITAQVLRFDPAASVYASNPIDIVGTLVGGLLFGLGMALAGTCSFGLLVRAGSGDLRALVSAIFVGIAAFAFTAGVLSPVRQAIGGIFSVDLDPYGGSLVPGLAAEVTGLDQSVLLVVVPAIVVVLLGAIAVLDGRMRVRPRLMIAAVVLGSAVAAGWVVTASAITWMETSRLESLSFVAPTGRLVLQVMTDALREVGFGVASVAGVVCGALTIAIIKDQVRWEAFDDVREMRRHLFGATLMGIGGVLAKGCTIGQGMSAASALIISAPIVMIGVVIGARVGLAILLEGHALWRLGGRGR